MLRPNPDSKRSKKRRNRGFRSLIESSRKHRRANNRQREKRFVDGVMRAPGEKAMEGALTAGGSLKYH